MESPATPSVADRFALIIGGLRAAVAARIGYYAVSGPMILYICNRLSRMSQRFQALAALILAGRLPAGRVYRPRAARDTAPMPPDPEPAAANDPWPVWRLLPMRRFAWLCIVAPNWAGSNYAAVWGAAMRELLADPRMAALLAATPRMGELLRPLCWGLGIEASLLRPRPAAADVADAPTSITDPECGGMISRGAMATTHIASSGKPPDEARVAGSWVPGFFAPA